MHTAVMYNPNPPRPIWHWVAGGVGLLVVGGVLVKLIRKPGLGDVNEWALASVGERSAYVHDSLYNERLGKPVVIQEVAGGQLAVYPIYGSSGYGAEKIDGAYEAHWRLLRPDGTVSGINRALYADVNVAVEDIIEQMPA